MTRAIVTAQAYLPPVEPSSSAESMVDAHARALEAGEARLLAALDRAGVAPEPLPLLHPARVPIAASSVSRSSERETLAALIRAMASPLSPTHGGVVWLDVDAALERERVLVEALQRSVGELPLRNMAAFKANHSSLLQFARVQADAGAGVEVASLPELYTALCVGVRPGAVVFGNTNLNARELLIAMHLGVTAFCFDHPAKLARVLDCARTREGGVARLRPLLRLAAPYASAALSMERFGLDVDKSPGLLEAVLDRLAAAGSALTGVSFHVGIGARSTAVYEQVFAQAEAVFAAAKARTGVAPWIVDIGGGLGFDDTPNRYLGTLAVADQVRELGRGVRRLHQRVPELREVWSEIGQGALGRAGSMLSPVEFVEHRDNPSRSARVCVPTLPGSFLWAKRSTPVHAEREQWLVTATGAWAVPVSRFVSLQPELWVLREDGEVARVDAEGPLVPTLVFGKSCEPTDCLNPAAPERGGEMIRFLLPDLSRRPANERYVLRLRGAAYMDTAGEFNGQTSRAFPWRYSLGEPARGPRKAPALVRAPTWEYRERLLSPNVVQAAQIHAARELIAEQFLEREQMIAWLRQTGQLRAKAELEALRYGLWQAVDECVGSGLSVVRLKLRPGQPDAEGEVVGALAAKVVRARDVPTQPLAMVGEWERRVSRLMFELEASLMRRARRLDGGLREKLFPMAYIAMTAKRPGEGAPAHAMRQRVVDLARGLGGIKTVTSMSTGERSCAVAERVPGCFPMFVTPYADIHFHGRRPFEGVRFGAKPGELRFYAHDLRGPHRALEPLPQAERLRLVIRDQGAQALGLGEHWGAGA